MKLKNEILNVDVISYFFDNLLIIFIKNNNNEL